MSELYNMKELSQEELSKIPMLELFEFFNNQIIRLSKENEDLRSDLSDTRYQSGLRDYN